jgi:hypothetical protein
LAACLLFKPPRDHVLKAFGCNPCNLQQQQQQQQQQHGSQDFINPQQYQQMLSGISKQQDIKSDLRARLSPEGVRPEQLQARKQAAAAWPLVPPPEQPSWQQDQAGTIDKPEVKLKRQLSYYSLKSSQLWSEL